METFKDKLIDLKKFFNDNETFIVREFSTFGKDMAICYFDEFVKYSDISQTIIEPLISTTKTIKVKDIVTFVLEKVLYATRASMLQTYQEAKDAIIEGMVVLMVDGEERAIKINALNIEKRTIIEPSTSNVIRGPREGFIEDLVTNLSLIKKRLKTEKLKMESLEVGTLTKTKVCLLYLKGVASPSVVNEIKKNISEIKIDGILDSYYIQAFLGRKPHSLFRQCGNTEKPDVVVGKLLEGRVAIVVDGSPFVLTLPFMFMEDLQGAEDYYDNYIKTSFVRSLRLLGIFLATVMPGVYVAFQLYHYEALPLKLLVTMLSSSRVIPMTPTVEILFVFLMFEILFEASLRIPKGLGSSLNIIGALILGDTAVKSNLASAPTIMIVALSSIALYLLPQETSVVRIIRIGFIFAGAAMGIIGIVVACIFICTYLLDMDAYGAPYLAPYAPFVRSDFKDFIIKKHISKLDNMPKSYEVKRNKRVDDR